MVPDAEFTSYYGRPVIKEPVWQAPDVAGYLFFGGLAGASSVLAAGAHLSGHRELARAAKASALGAISLSAAALVHDLGRPARFTNMLRVFKLTSPMSVGTWLLAAYGPVAGAAAVSAVTGILPAAGTAATLGAGLLGPAIATYTAALICDTAVPPGTRATGRCRTCSPARRPARPAAWACSPPRRAPPNPPGSSPSSARAPSSPPSGCYQALAAPRARAWPSPTRPGRTGAMLRLAEALTAGGLAGALLGRRSRALSALSGASLLAASALTRFGIFEAGLASARDPKYTIVPQRHRP